MTITYYEHFAIVILALLRYIEALILTNLRLQYRLQIIVQYFDAAMYALGLQHDCQPHCQATLRPFCPPSKANLTPNHVLWCLLKGLRQHPSESVILTYSPKGLVVKSRHVST